MLQSNSHKIVDEEQFLPLSLSSTPNLIQTSNYDLDSNFTQPNQKSKKGHPAAVLLLLGSVIGGSFIGAISNLIPCTGYLNKNAWRNAEIVIFCLPLAIGEYFYQKRKGVDYTKLITQRSTYGMLLFQALSQSLWAWGIIISTNNLIQSQAYVLCNLHGPFIALFLLANGTKLTKFEFLGMFLSAAGCLSMLMDPDASRDMDNFAPQISKYVAVSVAVLSSVFGAVFLMLNKKNSDTLPVFFLLTVMTFHIFVVTAVLAVIFDTDTQFFSMSPTNGIFGFLNYWDQNFWVVLAYGIVAGIMGQTFNTIATIFYESLVISSCLLTEPLLAQIVGYVLGIDMMPGILTFFGGLIAISGIFFIDKGSRLRQNQSQLVNRGFDGYQNLDTTNPQANSSFRSGTALTLSRSSSKGLIQTVKQNLRQSAIELGTRISH